MVLAVFLAFLHAWPCNFSSELIIMLIFGRTHFDSLFYIHCKACLVSSCHATGRASPGTLKSAIWTAKTNFRSTKVGRNNGCGFAIYIQLRLWSTSWKPLKCIQAPVVYISNYSWCSTQLFTETANSLAMLEAFPKFKGRLVILVPNISQGKRFFWVLVCYTGREVY